MKHVIVVSENYREAWKFAENNKLSLKDCLVVREIYELAGREFPEDVAVYCLPGSTRRAAQQSILQMVAARIKVGT